MKLELKDIGSGDTAIATVRGTDKDAVPHSIHTDNLTGSNVTTTSGKYQ